MTWNDRPKTGERWRRRVKGKVETRTVRNRTLGGEVIYVRGKLTRHAQEHRCSEAEWLRWQKEAKQID